VKREAAREESRKRKEEEKRVKEEAKKKKEEAKQMKEEAKRREAREREEEKKAREEKRMLEQENKQKSLEKQKNVLSSFLKKTAEPSSPVIKPSPMKEISSFRNLFRGIDLPPYTIRAPYLPVLPVPGATTLSPQEIDAAISAHDTGDYSIQVWLSEMRHRKAACKEHEKQKKKQETGDWDVIVFDCPQESAGKPKRKMKLLQFHENRRPAYFGTWSQVSHRISPRNPFKRDMDLLDYDYDSDEDWEDDLEGESLSDCEREDENETVEGDEEEDDGFLVPDGYLSEDEGMASDNELDQVQMPTVPSETDCKGKEEEEEEEELQTSTMDSKERRKKWKEKQNERGRLDKIAKLRPLAVGPVFYMHSEELTPQHSALIGHFKIIVLSDLSNGPIDPEAVQTKSEPKDKSLPESVLRDLVLHVHGSALGRQKIVEQFYDKYVTQPSLQKYSLSKNGLTKKVREIAFKEKRPKDTKSRWYVTETLIQSLGLEAECERIESLKSQPQPSSKSPLSIKKWIVRAAGQDPMDGTTTTTTPSTDSAVPNSLVDTSSLASPTPHILVPRKKSCVKDMASFLTQSNGEAI